VAGHDTIAALSSGRPPAAIAVLRTSGPRALAAAQALGARRLEPRQAHLRRLIDPSDGALIDQALILFFPAPNSATGEDIVEYQCHGSRATVDALLAALTRQPGVRLAEPGEFTRRALANGRIDLTEAEGLADLLAAETEHQRRSALVRASGVLHSKLDGWRDRLLAASAAAEVAIDYADEEDGAAAPLPTDDLRALASEIGELLAAPRVEPLRDGVRVVLAGPPNAGKSSLINALSQSERTIVTAIAGTTRDTIEVPLSIDGMPFMLVDTAGLRDSEDVVEAIGIDRARRELDRADILLWLGEASGMPDGAVGLHAKADLDESIDGRPRVSAMTGEGVDALLALLADRARSLLPRPDSLALDRRQHELLEVARDAIASGAVLDDPLFVGEELRSARHAIDQISGRAGVEELLDALFGRFCLGK
jgi:tRNA modification GTPase